MGVNIHHKNIIINGIIGENCIFHGNNCIGNKGTIDGVEQIPHIGNNVDFGYGSVVIGNVDIADDIKIGAGAVVVNSFTEKGITIAGVPAKKIVPKPSK
jgi:serine O-acetyltransferase